VKFIQDIAISYDIRMQTLSIKRDSNTNKPCSVCIEGLPLKTTADQVTELIKGCGQIEKVEMLDTDECTLSLVIFTTSDSALAAVKAHNETKFGDKDLFVTINKLDFELKKLNELGKKLEAVNKVVDQMQELNLNSNDKQQQQQQQQQPPSSQ